MFLLSERKTMALAVVFLFLGGHIMAKLQVGKNDLNTCYPDIVKEWDYEHNDGLRPNMVTAMSGRVVYWKCGENHHYKARIADKTTYNTGCPYCSGKKVLRGFNDIITLFPDIEYEWDYNKNEQILPCDYTKGSNIKVWWKCKNGHEYEQTIKNHIVGKQGCPYCASAKIMQGYNDLKTMFPIIADEWDYKKNGNISPSEVASHSSKKYWWLCKIGHSWQATVGNRTYGTGCPVCSKELHTSFQEQALFYYVNENVPAINRYIVDGYEFDVFIPQIKVAIEYDGFYYHNDTNSLIRENKKNLYCKNNDIRLIRIKEYYEDNKYCDNEKDIIYRDMRLGETYLNDVINEVLNLLSLEYNIEINKKVDILSDKELIWSNYISVIKNNSILKLMPMVAREWNYKKNLKLLPEYVSIGSHKKVWWVCPKGHEYDMAVKNRTIQNQGCPYCVGKKVLVGFNDLESKCVDVANEWDYEKNVNMKPSEFTSHSSKKVWWKCEKEHSYIASIYKRVSGRGCPYCAGKKVLTGYNDLQTTHPELCKDICDEKVEPTKISRGAKIKIHWKCQFCKYEWDAFVVNRACNGNKCPQCHTKI